MRCTIVVRLSSGVELTWKFGEGEKTDMSVFTYSSSMCVCVCYIIVVCCCRDANPIEPGT